MAITRVQATPKSTATSTTSVSMTFATPPAVGNGIVVAVTTSGWPTLSCTDNYGNAYTLDKIANDPAVVAVSSAVFHSAVVTSGASFSVTVTAGTAINWVGIALEVNGGLTVNVSSGGGGISTAPSTVTTTGRTVNETFEVAVLSIGPQTFINLDPTTPGWTQEAENLITPASEIDYQIFTGILGVAPQCKWVVSTSDWWATVQVAYGVTVAPPVTSVERSFAGVCISAIDASSGGGEVSLAFVG